MSFQAAQAGSPSHNPRTTEAWREPPEVVWSGLGSLRAAVKHNYQLHHVHITDNPSCSPPASPSGHWQGFWKYNGIHTDTSKKRGGRVLSSPLPLFFKGSGKIIKKQTKHHQTVKTLKFTFTKPFQKACVCIFSKLNLQPSPHDICHSYFCHKHSSS